MTQKEKAKLVPVSREPALLTERDADKSPVLECIDLGITFGGLKAVDNFNVTIGRTEITGLIGPNGAGKIIAACPVGIRSLYLSFVTKITPFLVG